MAPHEGHSTRGPARLGFFQQPAAEPWESLQPRSAEATGEYERSSGGERATGRWFAREARSIVTEALSRAGIEVGGTAPYDLEVVDERFYGRVLRQGSLGLGESYVDGWWDVPEIDSFVERVMSAGLGRSFRPGWKQAALSGLRRMTNPQSRRRAARNARLHYERGIDVFRAMLDSRMTYSSGYWQDADTLEQAQEAKLDLICRKVGLKEGNTLLDIGCGWGSLAGYAAERYGARVTGITVSEEQAHIARDACRGLPVDIQVRDYREMSGEFDAVVSVGMFEHVGSKNHRAYMETVDRCLAPGGISLVHTIAGNCESRLVDPWIRKWVFPGGELPTLEQIARSAEGLFVTEDVHSFGPDYDRTLMAWARRFEDAWTGLKASYDDRFRRLWRYYLRACAGAFRAREIQVLQVIMTRPGSPRPAGADAR